MSLQIFLTLRGLIICLNSYTLFAGNSHKSNSVFQSRFSTTNSTPNNYLIRIKCCDRSIRYTDFQAQAADFEMELGRGRDIAPRTSTRMTTRPALSRAGRRRRGEGAQNGPREAGIERKLREKAKERERGESQRPHRTLWPRPREAPTCTQERLHAAHTTFSVLHLVHARTGAAGASSWARQVSADSAGRGKAWGGRV